jgi:hypothetical protein
VRPRGEGELLLAWKSSRNPIAWGMIAPAQIFLASPSHRLFSTTPQRKSTRDVRGRRTTRGRGSPAWEIIGILLVSLSSVGLAKMADTACGLVVILVKSTNEMGKIANGSRPRWQLVEDDVSFCRCAPDKKYNLQFVFGDLFLI